MAPQRLERIGGDAILSSTTWRGAPLELPLRRASHRAGRLLPAIRI